MGPGGRLPAPPPKYRRRAAERIAPCLGAGASARRPPLCPWRRKEKKPPIRDASVQKLAPSLGAALRTTSGRRRCFARAARAKTEREEKGDRSRWRNFPACGALNWLACGAFRSACAARREPGQSARPAAPLCYSRLTRARSRGELACFQKRICSRSVCCCAADRLTGRLPFVFCFLLVVARQAVCHNV